jgi:hypothetical protein
MVEGVIGDYLIACAGNGRNIGFLVGLIGRRWECGMGASSCRIATSSLAHPLYPVPVPANLSEWQANGAGAGCFRNISIVRRID